MAVLLCSGPCTAPISQAGSEAAGCYNTSASSTITSIQFSFLQILTNVHQFSVKDELCVVMANDTNLSWELLLHG